MLALLSRVVLLAAALLSARTYARDFVRGYIRRLVGERLLTGLLLTVSQLGLLAVTAVVVRRLGGPLAGRLVGSSIVWALLAFNLARFVRSTLPDLAEARRHLAGPVGHVIRGMLGISIARELVDMELLVLALCLVLGMSARFGVGGTFQLFAPWQELFAGWR